MVFISHTEKDKVMVQPFATALAEAIGKENVFYDSWSIKPGDGIIDKMNEGLEKCKFFFLFLSNNSLRSAAVDLEWKNALMKKFSSDIRIITVRLEPIQLPALLSQYLYIDPYGQGIDYAIRQAVDLIQGREPQIEQRALQNVIAIITKNEKGIDIIFKALYFLEPSPQFILALDNEESDYLLKRIDQPMLVQGFAKGVTEVNGRPCNAQSISFTDSLKKGFSFKITLESKGKDICLHGIMKAVADNQFEQVPCIRPATL